VRRITGQADVDAGTAWLVAQEPRFAEVLQATGSLPLRLKPDGFIAILGAIVSQQISVASASAIRARVAAAGLTDPGAVCATGEAGLHACGLSRPKIRYVLAIAKSEIDWPGLRDRDDAFVRAALMALPGVGPWTAEIYMLSSLGRPDAFPAGDLALQEAAKALFDLDIRPSEKMLARMAAAWCPWRAVAARALWAWYRHIKGREGAG